MAHVEQRDFLENLKSKYPQFFKNLSVLECGSLNINGTVRDFFDNCEYLGIDLGEGNGVDLVVEATHLYSAPPESFDVVISCEMLEHDMYYDLSLTHMCSLLKPGGMLIITCATHGRPEHGTEKTSPADAPLLSSSNGWSSYYKNLIESDFRDYLPIDDIFTEYNFETNQKSFDIYFYGIKK